MARQEKTWVEKLEEAKAKEDLPKRFFCEKTKEDFLVPSPAQVEAEIRAIRKGRTREIGEIAGKLAAEHRVDTCCPMTTGIFAWIIAHANHELEQQGRKRVVPWWRLVKTGGELNPKYPGEGHLQKARLEAEGHRVRKKGQKLLLER